ncbi:hypothetical protein ACWT_2544 [Actinoplanes sp. SE50]|uniref:AbfB domain-containing protein n=1 Tax=unclassified Actinoplanes TaxID=2626549 RepID=UPI00023ED404|nr:MULTISPECIES: AbfB domain-containing protein [unclassified Actinoplanes]AEV83897.1 hypothetical protein ACPL_3002 [Actinoplanes sp. SE50/110]ATO81959.1 hypothetical protein ACWT_2544 [Actinoplanes sp. SE50]SLL99367.1 hypothetical protein ACSP50_2598 [Actinoplanes sp. SE50/110]
MPESPRSDRRPILALAAATLTVLVGYSAVATFLLRTERSPQAMPAPQPPPVWTMPSAQPPVSVAPAPSTRPVLDPVSRHSPAAPVPPPRPSRTTAGRRTAPPRLLAGTTLGLGFAGFPEYRIRRWDTAVIVAAVTAASSSHDRRDARFTVRAGRADPRCVSFESAGEPGRFLRHREFLLRLEPADGSSLFDQDATFCPERTGGGFALRSVNYPQRHLMLAADGIRLEPSATRQATVFEACPAL